MRRHEERALPTSQRQQSGAARWAAAGLGLVACSADFGPIDTTPQPVELDDFGDSRRGSQRPRSGSGCASIFDDMLDASGVGASEDTNELPSSATGAQEDGSSTGAPSECGDDRVCVSHPPEGWTGPVVVHVGDVGATPPDCAGAYPDAAPIVLEGYGDPGPASCDCTCELSLAS